MTSKSKTADSAQRLASSLAMGETLQQVDRTYVLMDRRKLSYFGGCDYFRLASHPEVLLALEQGLRRYGLNVAASRMTTGNHRLYELLEQRLADFFGVESALLVSSGYLTNLAVAQGLAGRYSHALIDARAHASLRDAAQLLGCPVIPFKHRDAAALAQAARKCGRRAKLMVLTDGMFSHDGALAPLPEFLAILPRDAALLVDDAHDAGVLGPHGRGAPEYLGVADGRMIQTVTLSKAFGAYGGAILGSRPLREAIVARSRLFAGNTPLPLPLVCAALKAVAILQHDRTLRPRLEANTQRVKTALRKAGWQIPDPPSPVVSLEVKSTGEAKRLRQRLLAHRIFPSLIRYPGGPSNGYFRFALSSEHTPSQLDALIEALLG